MILDTFFQVFKHSLVLSYSAVIGVGLWGYDWGLGFGLAVTTDGLCVQDRFVYPHGRGQRCLAW